MTIYLQNKRGGAVLGYESPCVPRVGETICNDGDELVVEEVSHRLRKTLGGELILSVVDVTVSDQTQVERTL